MEIRISVLSNNGKTGARMVRFMQNYWLRLLQLPKKNLGKFFEHVANCIDVTLNFREDSQNIDRETKIQGNEKINLMRTLQYCNCIEVTHKFSTDISSQWSLLFYWKNLRRNYCTEASIRKKFTYFNLVEDWKSMKVTEKCSSHFGKRCLQSNLKNQ